MSFSPYDKKDADIKARHITDALAILVDIFKNEATTTCIGCCQMSIEKNYGVVKRARTFADWYLNLHESKSMPFKRSERGWQCHMAKSKFAEDELLTIKFKSWAR